MRKFIPLCAWFSAAALALAANPAFAAGANQFSYVSNTGTDSPNTCTNATTDACASFQYALTQTASGGEIDCVDAGNYGTNFTITQSVTIDCAGAAAFTQGRITVNQAGIIVRLRNLSMNGGDAANFGIQALDMAALYVEHCVITNYNSDAGIVITPHTGTAQVSITDSVLSENDLGIEINPVAGAAANVTIARSRMEHNLVGVSANGDSGATIRATISDSVVSDSNQIGISASGGGSPVWVLVDQTQVSGSARFGLTSGGTGAKIAVRDSSIFANSTGLSGTIYSYGTNSLNGNGTNGAFAGMVGME